MWLPFALLGAICLIEAMRSHRWYWWLAAGVAVPLPLYIYNGHAPVLFIFVPFVAVGLWGFRFSLCVALFSLVVAHATSVTIALALVAAVVGLTTPTIRSRRVWVNTVLFSGSALLVTRGLLRFIHTHNADYFGRSRQLSVFNSEDWSQIEGWRDKFEFLIRRYWEFWDRLTFHPIPNGVDLSGSTAVVPRLMLYMAMAGLVLALIRRPGWPYLIAAALVLGAPLSAVFTDLETRRALVILPFLCLFAGVGLYEITVMFWKRHRLIGIAAALVSVILIGFTARQNIDDFFDVTVNSPNVAHTFGTDYRDTVEFLATLPQDDYAIFFCERWSIRYEPGRYLAPDVRGEDRLEKWGGTGGLSIDRSLGNPVFVLMNGYQDQLAELQRLYPGGEVVIGPMAAYLNAPSFVAYIIPPAP
jgi:hypothetical protein